MDAFLPLLQFLNKFMEITHEEFTQYILPYVELRRFEEKEPVSAIGSVENYFNFLLSGLARTFFVKNGEEVVVQIATEGHVIHAQESFHSRTPARYCVETIEATRFASISYDHLETIYAGSAKMQHLGRLVITFTLLLKERMQLQAVTLSARERFLHFVQKHPSLLQRVPQKYIASYLNITPETFSRFKQMLRTNKLTASNITS